MAALMSFAGNCKGISYRRKMGVPASALANYSQECSQPWFRQRACKQRVYRAADAWERCPLFVAPKTSIAADIR